MDLVDIFDIVEHVVVLIVVVNGLSSCANPSEIVGSLHKLLYMVLLSDIKQIVSQFSILKHFIDGFFRKNQVA